jgi:hypothetical protein
MLGTAGLALSTSTACPGCGTQVTAGAAACARCGRAIAAVDAGKATARGVWLTVLLSFAIVGAAFTLIDDLWSVLKPTRSSSLLVEIGYPLAHAAVLLGLLKMWRLRRVGAAIYFPVAAVLVAISFPSVSAIAAASVAYQALQYLPAAYFMTLGAAVYLNWSRFR